MYKYAFYTVTTLTSLIPSSFIFAASGSGITFQSLVTKFANGIITPLVTLTLGVALVLFLWALVKYMSQVGDEKAQGEARQMIMWGVVILTVMVSVWGLVRVVQNTFFSSGDVNTPISIPQIR